VRTGSDWIAHVVQAIENRYEIVISPGKFLCPGYFEGNAVCHAIALRGLASRLPYSKREPVQYSSKISPYYEFTFQILSAQAAQHRRVSEQNEGAGPLFHSISVFGRRTACTQHPDAS
jgi:hypothetical protein